VVFEDEMDAILEEQRLEDARMEELDPMEERPKRKREILSNKEYQLRKQRTDDLFEGLRQAAQRQGRSVSPTNQLSAPGTSQIWESQPAIDEKEERLNQGEKPDSESKPVPLPDDFDPPPPFHDGKDDDSDSEDGPDIMMVREALGNVRIDGGARHKQKGASTRIVLTVRQIRRVMAAKESLFKFGTFVPRSERKADASPEAPR
jgi:hypothetical protein